ncbi:MAG: hypothetical protein EPO32_00940 [Anaerolineae bacterium]|nr:MAG: hypothetical protein EPO32_00940 [Anaerolineae bacterium]
MKTNQKYAATSVAPPQANLEERKNEVKSPTNHTVQNSGVRESLLALPSFVQPLLTWVTGKPPYGARSKHTPSNWFHLVSALAALFGGAFASWVVVSMQITAILAVPILLLAWMVTVSGARKLLIMISHQCVHGKFSGNKVLDRIVMELVSTTILVQDFQAYQADHVSIHHSKQLATLEDPDVKFLVTLGFLPGLQKAALWRRLWWTVVSPRFHRIFLQARLKANFISAPSYRRFMSLVWWTAQLSLVSWLGLWSEYAIAWVFPLTILYHISALLQFTCEHRWLQIRDPKQSGRWVLARLTAGRFMGEPAPDQGWHGAKKVVAWLTWFGRMLFLHLPARVFVLMGDLPQHDHHHRHPESLTWVNAAYARQEDLEAGSPGWPEPYSEVWGLGNAIDHVFEVLSSLPPIDNKSSLATNADLADVMNGM